MLKPRILHTHAAFSLGDVKGQLEEVASRLGLKFETQHSSQTHTYSFFIISDAFFSEVCCQGSGTVTTVRLVQASSQVTDSFRL